jgi:hypothetical protein
MTSTIQQIHNPSYYIVSSSLGYHYIHVAQVEGINILVCKDKEIYHIGRQPS